jgi:hypothetical protein
MPAPRTAFAACDNFAQILDNAAGRRCPAFVLNATGFVDRVLTIQPIVFHAFYVGRTQQAAALSAGLDGARG